MKKIEVKSKKCGNVSKKAIENDSIAKKKTFIDNDGDDQLVKKNTKKIKPNSDYIEDVGNNKTKDVSNEINKLPILDKNVRVCLKKKVELANFLPNDRDSKRIRNVASSDSEDIEVPMIHELEDIEGSIGMMIRSQNSVKIIGGNHTFGKDGLKKAGVEKGPIGRRDFIFGADTIHDKAYADKYPKILVKDENGAVITAHEYKIKDLSLFNQKKSIRSKFKPDLSKVPPKNLHTFKGPLCKLKNLDREGLINHVRKNHPQDKAVCPIGVVQPYGDPNYKTCKI